MRRIFCLGGGGYLIDCDEKLDQWWMSLAGREHPNVLLIPTATGDSLHAIDEFARRFQGQCNVTVLCLFERSLLDLSEAFKDVDIVYVLGGNTANMLAVWRIHGLVTHLHRAYDRGVILGGLSAGAICWGTGGTTDSFGGLGVLQNALGFLPFSFSPHHEEPGRKPLFEKAIADGRLTAGYGIDNNVGLLFEDGKLAQVVSQRPWAHAYKVTADTTCELTPSSL